MATAETESGSVPGLPDYVLDPNAVLKDKTTSWRYGKAPDYTNTRKVYEETRTIHHEAGSLPDLVSNLVKNWEIEASFKTSIKDWRTIDHSTYTFAINGGPPQTAEHMLKVGTYNAIITPNEFYSPEASDFASSHKTFKRMMPTFAWEVLEVYSGPPKVVFKWRHWGTMKNDYVGFNDKGEKVTAMAHGGPINIQGVTIATVDNGLRVQTLETWFDPLDMFRQIAPNGIVDKMIRTPIPGKDLVDEMDGQSEGTIDESNASVALESTVPKVEGGKDTVTAPPVSSDSLKNMGAAFDTSTTEKLEAGKRAVDESGNAIAMPAESVETIMTHDEMSKTAVGDCPFLNRE